jgi:autotransporter-associated beta strand protein
MAASNSPELLAKPTFRPTCRLHQPALFAARITNEVTATFCQPEHSNYKSNPKNPQKPMKPIPPLQFRFARIFSAASILFSSFVCAHAQTYNPSAWVNDPFTTNASWLVLNPNTSSPTYTNIDANPGGNMYGFSPIGSSIILANDGDTAVKTEQITLAGVVNTGGNIQFRSGMYYRGARPNDTGWFGYQISAGTATGGTLYELTGNTGQQFGNGGASFTPALSGTLTSAGYGAGTYDYKLSVTRLNSGNTALIKWSISGINGNTYLFAGRFTNNSVATQGGVSFDNVGFLKGGAVFNGTGGNTIGFSNVLVTVGQFRDGIWTNDADANWSSSGNWTNGLTANGFGFVADFSQINPSADRTVTLDSSRTIGALAFGSTSGGLNNWFLNSSGGSVLTLDSGIPHTLGAPTVTVSQNAATINSSIVSSNGLTKTGNGTLLLRGANTVVGVVNVNGGVLDFSSLANLPLASTVSALNFGGGTLRWATGNTFDISSPGFPISFAGTAGLDVGANNINFANSFGDGGIGGLIKLGSGTLTLGSFASYGGSTIISNGVLALGASGSIGSTTNITILAGATFNPSAAGVLTLNSGQTLAGSGTVIGNVSATSGSTISPGTSAGTLTVNGNLTLGGGGLNFELSDVTTAGSGVNDEIIVSGNLDISVPTTISISLLTGSPGIGTYTLFAYNTFSGSAANLSVPPGFVVTNNTVAKTIGLIVTHVPAALTWLGDGGGNLWDIGTTANWLQSGTNQFFFTGDTVTFDNTGSASPPVNISGVVSPGSVTVNSSQNYAFTTANSGGIATGRVIKNGTGTLTLETDNTYSGSTLISGGVLAVGGPNAGGVSGTLGTGPTTNNSVLVFNRSVDYTYATNILGTGNITNAGSATVTLSGSVSGSTMNMSGSGTLRLFGSNTYTGLTTISAGSLEVHNSSALGTTAAGTVVSSGGALYINENVDVLGESLTIAGSGPDAVTGALRKGGNGVSTFGGSITLTGDSMITVDGGSTLNLTNAGGISGSGFNLTLGGAGNGNITRSFNLGAGSLTKNDGGTWTIASSNNYTGKTIINAGILAIAGTNALGGVSGITPDYITLNGGSLGITNNLTFNDGLRGITANGSAGGFNISAGLTLTVANAISGAGAITKANAGTLVLSGASTFSGTFNVDNNINLGDDGIVIIAHPNAISSVQSPIAIRNTLGASSSLQLSGSNGNITISQDITLNGRSPITPGIENLSGTNTLAGSITLNGAGQYRIQSDTNVLTMSGTISNNTTAPITLSFQGSGDLTVSGTILDNGNALSITKNGAGTLKLNGANTYSGSTTVSGGALGGTGSIAGTVSILAGGTLSPGASIGTLTINSNLSLAGNTFIEVDKTSGNRDQVAGLTSVAYGGTLTVSNLSGNLVPGDSFQIFPATSFTGNFDSITGAGAAWSFNPTSGVLSVVIPSTPTPIGFNTSGGNITLFWPSTYTGWILQAQTNTLAVGLKTNWVDLAGSAGTNSVTLPAAATNPTVFFRLRHP